MKAVLVKEPGGTEQMQLVEVEKPKPNKEEVLVKVKASAVNRADLVKRVGKYPNQAKKDISLGLEVSGIIEEVGNANSNYKVGDEVCGLMPEGGYAEYALLDRKSTRLNSSHVAISYAVFCLKKKKNYLE